MKVAFALLLEQRYSVAVLDSKGDLSEGFQDLAPEVLGTWSSSTPITGSTRRLPIYCRQESTWTRNSDGKAVNGPQAAVLRQHHIRPQDGVNPARCSTHLVAVARGNTLYCVSQFLEDSSYRSRVLGSVRNRGLREFWRNRNLSQPIIDHILNGCTTS